ncbi:MAG: hypothetical protein DWH91_13260 [Planctomycetota bacterium]|nr:MAG: hypothetical protein DWH91_13260 [Planctomycetota bacterium]
MPIQFRCKHCGRVLSISSRKAGATVNCPACTEPILVPGEVPETAIVDKVAPTQAPLDPAPRSPNTASLWEDSEAPPEPKPKRKAPEDGLDMTPMVDVTFQLLIFFMITASFAVQKALQTTAPEPNEDPSQQVVQVEQIQEESVVVSIDANDAMLVDDEPIEGIYALVEVLQGKMGSEQKNNLLIEADYKASHGAVVAVIDAGITAGMQGIRKKQAGEE